MVFYVLVSFRLEDVKALWGVATKGALALLEQRGDTPWAVFSTFKVVEMEYM